MKDEVVFRKLYDEYTKEYGIGSFKNYIINYSILSLKESEISTLDSINCKIFCVSKIINSLLRELFKSKLDKFNGIRKEITDIIRNGNIDDIDRIIKYELKFYFEIEQKRLIDVLIENYVQSAELKNSNESIDPILESSLNEYYTSDKKKLCSIF